MGQQLRFHVSAVEAWLAEEQQRGPLRERPQAPQREMAAQVYDPATRRPRQIGTFATRREARRAESPFAGAGAIATADAAAQPDHDSVRTQCTGAGPGRSGW
jgi:hypothetical protein